MPIYNQELIAGSFRGVSLNLSLVHTLRPSQISSVFSQNSFSIQILVLPPTYINFRKYGYI
jgi:hypothetical protein